MSLPPGMTPYPGLGKGPRHGVIVGLFPSTRSYPMELQVTSAGATAASSKWTSILLGGSSVTEVMSTVTFGLSTRRYYFRARHRASSGAGVQNGPFTATISAKPTTLRPILLSPTINAAKNVEVPGADVWISSANKPRVGSQATSSYLTKHIRFVGASFTPDLSSQKFRHHPGSLGLSPFGSTQTKGFLYHFPLPPGVTLTSVTVGYRRFKVNSVCNFILYRFTDTGAQATLLTLVGTTSTAAGYRTMAGGVTQAITTAVGVLGFANLKTSDATTDKAELGWVKMTYRMPDYARTL